MKINGEYTFAAPRDIVWRIIQNPEVLASVLPGCEKLELVEENQYQGILNIKIGPVQGKFNGEVALANIEPPASYDISVNGKGAPGFVKGNGTLRFEEDGDMTQLHYDGDAQVGGRLASVGQRLLDTSAKAIIRQSLEGLGQQIQQEQMAAAARAAGLEPAPPQPITPPSQTEFALGVAKNFVAELLPESEEDKAALLQKAYIAAAGLLLITLLGNWLASRIAKKVVRQLKRHN